MVDILESTGEEVAVAARWLSGVLKGDTTLLSLPGVGGDITNIGAVAGKPRVYEQQLPEGVSYPAVLFAFQGGADHLGVGATRVLMTGLWQVVMIKKDADIGWSPSITKRLDFLLHRRSGSVTTGEVVSCVREAPFDLTEEDAGVYYRRRGGIYRLQVQSN